MKVTTSKGKTYDAAWAFAPMRSTGQMMMEINDGRRLPEIAEEMDGCEEIRARRGEAEGEPETIYAGYTRLAGMTAGRTEGSMLITLERE